MDIYEIYLMHHPWNGCDDARPWVIIDFPVGRDVIGCFPIATECYGGQCFYISAADPDFFATGLAHSSNIIDQKIIEIPSSRVVKRIGCITGKMLEHFKSYTGI